MRLRTGLLVAALLITATPLARAEPVVDPGAVAPEAAAAALFDGAPPADCAREAAPIECMLRARYRDDRKAAALALRLHREAGGVAGIGAEELMDGGYRGAIRLVPQRPVGKHRRHLAWVVAAAQRYQSFFDELYQGQSGPRYRWRDLTFRFVQWSIAAHRVRTRSTGASTTT